MANKDLTINPKVEKSALNEFMQFGFRKASVHNIAKNANVTTGALYTRYKNKDDMFSSLVQNITSVLFGNNTELLSLYEHAMTTKKFEDFNTAIKAERTMHVDLFFKYHEECQLLFCKSDGSTAGQMLEKVINDKIASTTAFMKFISTKEIDTDIIELILTQTMNSYRFIFNKNYNKERTIMLLEKTDLFYEPAWKSYFNEITN